MPIFTVSSILTEMIKARYSDKKHIIQMLTQSFDTNKSVNYVVKQDHKRSQRLKALMDYSFEMCWHFGEVFITEDGKGALLLFLSEKKRTNLKSVWLDVKLVLKAIGISRVGQVLKRESIIKQNHPKEFIYLWYVGVQTDYQGKGIGSSLLRNLLAMADELKKPVYLETSMEQNLPLYKRFGFEVYNTAAFDYTLYMLKRERDETM